MTLQQAFDQFILSRKLAGLSEKTIQDYTLFVNKFVSLYPGLPAGELSQEQVDSYILSLSSSRLSPATFATYVRHLKVFLRWMSGICSVSYDYRRIKVPKSPKKHVKLYADEEIRQIFDAVDAVYGDDWLCIRNKCVVALMLDSGLRQSEVTGLLWRNISFPHHNLLVTGKGSKDRIVPLGNLSASLLREYKSACPCPDARYVFVSRSGERLTGNAVRLFMQRIGRQLPFEFSSHKLRHNFATNYCLDQYSAYGNIDIYRLMYLLGHEDVSTTRRYLHMAYEIIAAQNNISHLDKIF